MGRRPAFLLLLLWVLVAPIPFASVPEADVGTSSALARFLSAGGGYAIFRGLGYVLLALLLPSLLRGRRAPLAPGDSDRLLFPLAALLGLGVLQLVPLPLAVHGFLAPAHAADAAALLPGHNWIPTTVDPGLTREAVVRLFLLLVAALAVLHTARTPARAGRLLAALLVVACLQAAYGILETKGLSDTVLGFPKPGDRGAVTGTFFYRGNFAALAAAGAGVAVAFLVGALARRRLFLAALPGAAVFLLGGAVLLSRSRAGLVALAAALAVGVVLRIRSLWFRTAAAVALVAAILVVGLSFGPMRERFELFTESASSSFLDVRVPAWEATLDLTGGRPVLGCGLGAYRRAIHLTQDPKNPGELYFAHSDPLNLLAEGGVPGLLFGLAVALLGLSGAVRLARRSEGAPRTIGIACAAGLVGLLAMAAVDFPLQIPATALLFVILAFLPAAVGAGEEEPPPWPLSRRVLAGTAALAAAGVLLVSVGEDLARGYDHPGTVTEGEALLADGDAALRAGNFERARERLDRARDLMPFDGATRLRLAVLAWSERDPEEWRREIRAAHRLARGRGDLLFDIGRAAQEDSRLRELALAAFREAAQIEPKWLPATLAILRTGPREAVVPEEGWAWVKFADAEHAAGRTDAAIDGYWHAFDLKERGDFLRRLARIYETAGRGAEGRGAFSGRGLAWPLD